MYFFTVIGLMTLFFVANLTEVKSKVKLGYIIVRSKA